MVTHPDNPQLERDFLLHVLELAHHDEPRALLAEALRLVVQFSRAQHGYIEIETTSGSDVAVRFADSTAELDATLVKTLLSSTIIRSALVEGKTIQTRALSDPRFADAPSVRGNKIDAVICVPIGTAPACGVLYLQGTPAGRPFTPAIIRLCEIFARHLGSIAPTLVRNAARNADSTTHWRTKLVGADTIIGTSQALARVLKAAASVAARDIPVLLTGPSGSGKTVLADIIARTGTRADQPFIALNCANLQTQLVESELFGALPGAHSTATRRTQGKVEAADGGTLFLDEVSELTPEAQAKLLQFLQEGLFFPLGATQALRSDTRIIAATNADLRQRVDEGRFREDLYYRLCVFEIAVPPLDERRIDIVPLAESFLRDATARLALPTMHLSRDAQRALETADWPGNIRQLRNAIDAAAIRACADEVDLVEAEHIFPDHVASGTTTFQALMRTYQRQVLSEALDRHGGNVTETAQALGLGRSSLYQLIKTLGIDRC